MTKKSAPLITGTLISVQRFHYSQGELSVTLEDGTSCTVRTGRFTNEPGDFNLLLARAAQSLLGRQVAISTGPNPDESDRGTRTVVTAVEARTEAQPAPKRGLAAAFRGLLGR